MREDACVCLLPQSKTHPITPQEAAPQSRRQQQQQSNKGKGKRSRSSSSVSARASARAAVEAPQSRQSDDSPGGTDSDDSFSGSEEFNEFAAIVCDEDGVNERRSTLATAWLTSVIRPGVGGQSTLQMHPLPRWCRGSCRRMRGIANWNRRCLRESRRRCVVRLCEQPAVAEAYGTPKKLRRLES